MTNPARLSGPRHLDSFIMTPNARTSIGTLQKDMPTLTRTATNQTAGPLGLREVARFRDYQRTKARVWLTPNTCFFANPGQECDIYTVTLRFKT